MKSTPGYPRHLAVAAVLVTLPLVLTLGLYHRVILLDIGLLGKYDDAILLSQLRHGGLASQQLLALHGTHFIPLIRLTFAVAHQVFGNVWWPYGLLLVLGHVGLCVAVSAAIYVFTRSLVLAASVAALLAVSRNLALAILSNFIYFNIYLLVVAIVAVLFPALSYARRPSRAALIATNLLVAVALFTLSSGILALAGAVVWYGFGRLLLPADSSGPGAMRRGLQADAWFLGSLGVVAIVYAAFYAVALAPTGFRFSAEVSACSDPDSARTAVFDRFLYVVSHGFLGLVWVRGINTLPFYFEQWRYAFPAVLVVLGGIGAYRLHALRRGGYEARLPYVAYVACVVLLIGASVMLLLGRSCLQLDHMRHGAYVTVFGVMAAGLGISWLMSAVPATVRAVLSLAVVVATIVFVVMNVQFVMAWNWYVHYQ